MNLKKIFCNHTYRHKNMPDPNGKSDLTCVKCGKEKYGKSRSMQHPANYTWCGKCGNDLIRDSHIAQEGEIHKYKCSECGKITRLRFDIAPLAIEVNEKGSPID